MTDCDGKKLKKGEQVWVAWMTENPCYGSPLYQRLAVVASSRRRQFLLKVAWVTPLGDEARFIWCHPGQLVRCTGQD